MKLQTASKKTIARVGAGTVLCGAILLLIYGIAVLVGMLPFESGVVLGGICGTAVAMINFVLLCLTVQHTVQMQEDKRRKAFMQWSYHLRLIVQGVWVLAAFRLPWIHPVASALPLLFPPFVIFLLRWFGKDR